MMNHLSGCSINLGSDVADYLLSCRSSNKINGLPPFTEEEIRSQIDAYPTVQKTAAQALEKVNCDFLCLQECNNLDRPEIEALKSKYFFVHHPKSTYPDCMLAFKKERFKESVEFIEGTLDYIVVKVTDKITNQRFAFISVHLDGFSLEADLNEQASQAYNGDLSCYQIEQCVKNKCSDCALVIFGGDMNAIYRKSDIRQYRFDVLKKAKFEIAATGQTTAIFDGMGRKNFKHPKRELDYFAVKNNSSSIILHRSFLYRILSFIFPFFFRHSQLGISATVQGSYNPEFDPKKNPSDHRPIYLNIKFITKASSLPASVGVS